MKVAVILSGAIAAVSALTTPTFEERDLIDLEERGTGPLGFTEKFETISLFDALNGAIVDGANVTDILASTDIIDAGKLGDGTSSIARARCANPKIRKEWRNLRAVEKKAFVTAIKCLWDKPKKGLSSAARNRYEEIVYVHQQVVGSVHQAGSFLVWHRHYLHVFGSILRTECGYPGAYPIPWWDETRNAGNFAASDIFSSAYFGALPTIRNGQGTCITNGMFANRRIHIGPGASNVDRCLSRGEDKGLTSNVNAAFVNACNSRTTYEDMRQCSEYGPHAYGHNGMGPVMAEVAASPSDPVFFLHHAFVDRNWWKWQQGGTSRYTTISGCASIRNNACPPLTLDTVLSTMNLRPSVRVRDVLDAQNTVLCYKYDY